MFNLKKKEERQPTTREICEQLLKSMDKGSMYGVLTPDLYLDNIEGLKTYQLESKHLDELYKHGWELVSSHGQEDFLEYIFKRMNND